MLKPHLVIMLKAPIMGAVKTRLAKDIGPVKACQFYRRNCAHLIARLGSDPRWNTLLAISPITALTAPFWPVNSYRIAQSQGDLGKRMQTIFDNLFPGPVIIIGTDIPAITNTHIASAFRELKKTDVIIGPSNDGGYWAIGQRRTPKTHQIFKNVRWSSQYTLADTKANLRTIPYSEIDNLQDVDTGKDYDSHNKFSTRLLNTNL